MNEQQENIKKLTRQMRTFMWIAIIGVIITILGYVCSKSEKKFTINNQSFTVPQEEPIEANYSKFGEEIAQWEGKSLEHFSADSRNTEIFYIPTDQWIITWSTKPGKFGPGGFTIEVNNPDGTLNGWAANEVGENHSSCFWYGKGKYSLTIIIYQSYIVKIKTIEK